MKTKSKLMIISSFALAMVASLVMAFAVMNVTNTMPSTVSATPETSWEDCAIQTTRTVYYKNNGKFYMPNMTVYYYNDTYTLGDFGNSVAMTYLDTNWWKAEINSQATNIIFSNNANSSEKETEITEVTPGTTDLYYDSGFSDYFNNIYYLVGTINSWSNQDEYKFTASAPGYVASLLNVTLSAGTEIRVKKSDSWDTGWREDDAITKDLITFSKWENNGVVKENGVYNFYRDNDNCVYVRRATTEGDLQAVKSKISTSGEHLLLVTAFELDTLTRTGGTYSIGYSVTENETTTPYLSGVYYTGVSFKSSDAGNPVVTKYAVSLYGETCVGRELIVKEISFNSANNYSVKAQIWFTPDAGDAVLVAESSAVTYTAE